MVTVAFDPHFERAIRKLKDGALKERLKKQIEKIVQSPEVGKPMRYTRKDTREVRIHPFRLAYIYVSSEDKIILLDIYHKDEQ